MASVTFPLALGGDGSTVTDDANPSTGLANGGHRTRFVPSLAQTVLMSQTAVTKASEAEASAATALAAPGTNATSTTSLAISVGSKSLTVQTGKSFVVGMGVIIASTTTPSTQLMHGIITAYTSGTGALVVDVTYIVGSGTLAAWTISISAPITTEVPAQAGQAGKFFTTDGTNGSWAFASAVIRSARTSNSILVAADRSALIDITSGTFTQTVTAAATLGSGWFCWYRNSGTGIVTIDPNASEIINGAFSLSVAAGQTLLLQTNGTSLTAVVFEGAIGDHGIWVHTGNGRGSTNTCIRRFTTTQAYTGTAIAYADSATLGAAFTINAAGIYAMTYGDSFTGSAQNFGVSLNSAQLSTNIAGITAANRLGMTHSVAAGLNNSITLVALLAAGDVVRPHDGGSNNGVTAAESYFQIRKVG